MKSRVIKLLFVILGFLSLLIGILFVFEQLGYGIPCLFHTITGWYCPGCGMTRAIVTLVHGNIIEALHNNILLIFLPLVAFYFGVAATHYLKGEDKIFPKIPSQIISILFLLILFFGVIRNIPGFEFLLPR